MDFKKVQLEKVDFLKWVELLSIPYWNVTTLGSVLERN